MAKDKDKDKVQRKSNNDDTVQDETPNFFCRLPERSDTLSPRLHRYNRNSSPPPLAFLQRIVRNYQPQLWGEDEISVEEENSTREEANGRRSNGESNLGSRVSTPPSAKVKTSSSASNLSEMASSAHSSTRSPSSSTSSAIENGDPLSNPNGTKTKANQEEDPPWFSQMANLPHLRSAGIPLIPPDQQKKADASTKLKEGLMQKMVSRPGKEPRNGSTAAGDLAAQLNPSQGPFSSTKESHTMEKNDSMTSLQTATSSPSSALYNSTDSSNAHLTSGNTESARPSVFRPTPMIPATQTNDIASTSSLPLIPPENFAMVNSWVYRSSFPKKKHFPFLATLGLKSVLTLILEEYPEPNTKFLDENGITFFQFGIPGNKEPFVQIPQDKITAALVTIMDRRNHPMLIHCNKGKHRTGCLIGCLRKLQQWSLTTIFDEYRRFSFPKSRSMDQEFIELYPERLVWDQVERLWLPRWTVLSKGLRGQIEGQQRKDKEENIQRKRNGSHPSHASLVDTRSPKEEIRVGKVPLFITTLPFEVRKKLDMKGM